MPVIIPIETKSLGDRSYLAHDGEVALVVDPQRDVDRVLDLAEAEGVRVTHVFETHIHNDYVTGGRALADVTGAAYHVNEADPVSFDRVGVKDGDVIEVSPRLSIRVIATPGHTFTHLSYALDADGERVGIFSGGSLLFGSTGRPDLLGPDHTDALVHHQYASAHRIAEEVPDDAAVLPTHGFGSFCSATQASAESSTVGAEKRTNPALTKDEQAWVDDILAGLEEWPAYYAHMGSANLDAPAEAPDLSEPATADAEAIRTALEAGEWVVDLRHREAYAKGHAKRTFNFGLDGQFATYLGWMIPWGTPLTLLGESRDQVATAQRELVRIGIDRPKASATGSPQEWTSEELGSFERATFADLAQVRHHREVIVLDVRRASEYLNGHIEGAVNVPLHHLLDRLDDVPAGELWIHCAGGYRASIAASVLAATGQDLVVVDDSFDNAGSTDLSIVAGGPDA